MSDRASAGIFSAIFEYLAVDPTPRAIEFAGELWRRSWDYDFGYSQLVCDGALIALGLAKAITRVARPVAPVSLRGRQHWDNGGGHSLGADCARVRLIGWSAPEAEALAGPKEAP